MLRCLVGVLTFFTACGAALSQGGSAAPQAIGGVSALLESVPSDPAKLAELQARYRAKPPRGGNGFSLARFHYERAQAAGELGDSRGEIEGLRKAAALVQHRPVALVGEVPPRSRVRLQLPVGARDAFGFGHAVRPASIASAEIS